mgnify:CR=1 FL=1
MPTYPKKNRNFWPDDHNTEQEHKGQQQPKVREVRGGEDPY